MKKKFYLQVEREIKQCNKCPLHLYRNKAVPGEGPINAKIFFVGEAPGRLEDQVGRPFIGPAGKFLEKILESIGISRKSVFLTGIVKCRPPNNRKPRKSEVKTCLPYTLRQIKIIRPKIVVLLGSTALEGLLGIKNVSNLHGKIIRKNDQLYFITFHPSAARRFPKIRRLALEDFKKLKAFLIKEKIWSLKP